MPDESTKDETPYNVGSRGKFATYFSGVCNMTDARLRRVLVAKGLVRPAPTKVDQQPGKVIAVRRVDDRPVTRSVPCFVKG